MSDQEDSEKERANRKTYNQSKEGKAAGDRYRKSEKGRKTREDYNKSEAGKARTKRYRKSEKGIKAQAAYASRPDVREKK
ncbi:hypothetical protein [Streptomyces mayonensis]|uniref:hypothetical protein n=1 Tax=Streptomyces mayonensis TaxID=2750816 RepID=UPI001C1E5A4E|nr:hypothetical protein [Streptomyces sp. A108]MBU6536749.1 hypothetical protein [Streptomyces sp. A108]